MNTDFKKVNYIVCQKGIHAIGENKAGRGYRLSGPRSCSETGWAGGVFIFERRSAEEERGKRVVHGEGTASAKALGQEHASCCPRGKRRHVAGVSWGNAGGGEGEGGG